MKETKIEFERIELERKAEHARQILQEAVADALREKKARGQYAIFGTKDGKAIRVEAEDIRVPDPVAPVANSNPDILAPRGGAI